LPDWLGSGGPGYSLQFETVESNLLRNKIKQQEKTAKRILEAEKQDNDLVLEELKILYKHQVEDLSGWSEAEKKRGFKIVKHRWKVERTNGWMGKNRRLVKNYEVYANSHEVYCYIAMIFLMLKRLTGGCG